MSERMPLRFKILRGTARLGVRRAVFVALLAFACFATQELVAQQRVSGKPVTHPSSKTAKSSARRAGARKAAEAPVQQPVAAAAETPPMPAWPANEQPQQAHIIWDSHGLKIEAANSSLDQILHEVATVTGVKVEGFSKDQRVFGTYGPGPAREVLSGLLDGSDYNVLMVGGAGDAPPSRIVLSMAGPAGPPQPRGMQSQQSEDDAEADEPPPEPPMPQPPLVPQQVPQPTSPPNPFGNNPRVPIPMSPQQVPMPPDQQQQQNNQQQTNPPQYNFPQYNPQQ